VTDLPPPAVGCVACAARDAVIAEQAEAVEAVPSEMAALGMVATLRRRLPSYS